MQTKALSTTHEKTRENQRCLIKAIEFSLRETHHKWPVQLIPQRTRKACWPWKSYNQYLFYSRNHFFTYGCGQKVCGEFKVNEN